MASVLRTCGWIILISKKSYKIAGEAHGASNIIKKNAVCGADLLQWPSKEFGSLKRRKKELNEQLLKLQKLEQNEQIRVILQDTEREMDHVLKLEETMWYQRSRALWLRYGDKNSIFFSPKGFPSE